MSGVQCSACILYMVLLSLFIYKVNLSFIFQFTWIPQGRKLNVVNMYLGHAYTIHHPNITCHHLGNTQLVALPCKLSHCLLLAGCNAVRDQHTIPCVVRIQYATRTAPCGQFNGCHHHGDLSSRGGRAA